MVEQRELEAGASRSGLVVIGIEEYPERSDFARGIIVRKLHKECTGSPPPIPGAAHSECPNRLTQISSDNWECKKATCVGPIIVASSHLPLMTGS